jgi:hypothetical protein
MVRISTRRRLQRQAQSIYPQGDTCGSVRSLLGAGVSNSAEVERMATREAIRTKHGSIEFVTQIVNIFYMASSFLKSICCCFWQTETDADPVYDETTRLIPEEPAIDMYVLPNLYVLMGIDHEFFCAMVLSSTVHQRLYERLSQIVRAKERCGLLALVSFIADRASL